MAEIKAGDRVAVDGEPGTVDRVDARSGRCFVTLDLAPDLGSQEFPLDHVELLRE